jgi:hypothetical protein
MQKIVCDLLAHGTFDLVMPEHYDDTKFGADSIFLSHRIALAVLDPNVPRQEGATLEASRQQLGKRAKCLGSHSVWTGAHGATQEAYPSESASQCVVEAQDVPPAWRLCNVAREQLGLTGKSCVLGYGQSGTTLRGCYDGTIIAVKSAPRGSPIAKVIPTYQFPFPRDHLMCNGSRKFERYLDDNARACVVTRRCLREAAAMTKLTA